MGQEGRICLSHTGCIARNVMWDSRVRPFYVQVRKLDHFTKKLVFVPWLCTFYRQCCSPQTGTFVKKLLRLSLTLKLSQRVTVVHELNLDPLRGRTCVNVC